MVSRRRWLSGAEDVCSTTVIGIIFQKHGCYFDHIEKYSEIATKIGPSIPYHAHWATTSPRLGAPRRRLTQQLLDLGAARGGERAAEPDALQRRGCGGKPHCRFDRGVLSDCK